MDEYISRSAAIEAMEDMTLAKEVLEAIPAADVVERKKGKWIRPVPGDGEPYCSECKAEAPLSCGRFLHHWYTNFCPNCGAKMEG